MHLFYYNICIYEIYLLILQKQLRIDAETSAEGQGVGEAKCSWLQFMNNPIPLSQQADSSPNQWSSSQKPSPCKGEVTEGQRGKKSEKRRLGVFRHKTKSLFGAASEEPG